MDLKRKLTEGRPIGSWLSAPSPDVAELLAGHDFDFLCVDTEHAPTTVETVQNVVRAIDAAQGTDSAASTTASNTTEAIVRVPWNDPVRIKRILDTGPAGIMAPQINSADEARDLVEAVRYPPQSDDNEKRREDATGPSCAAADSDDLRGRRGIAGARASAYGRNLDEYVATANEDLAVIAQIESADAVDRAGEIATVPGIDALLIGPADLSAALGCFREFDDPIFTNAVERTLAAAGEAGVPVGTLATTPEKIDHWLDAGFDFLITGTDAGYLHAGATEAIERYGDRVEE